MRLCANIIHLFDDACATQYCWLINKNILFPLPFNKNVYVIFLLWLFFLATTMPVLPYTKTVRHTLSTQHSQHTYKHIDNGNELLRHNTYGMNSPVCGSISDETIEMSTAYVYVCECVGCVFCVECGDFSFLFFSFLLNCIMWQLEWRTCLKDKRDSNLLEICCSYFYQNQ